MTDGLTDDQREPIVPRHYCVAGYKNDTMTFSVVDEVALHLSPYQFIYAGNTPLLRQTHGIFLTP